MRGCRVANINYMRLYSPVSLVLIFFSFCIVGWLWEVSLHLIADGVFVKRGMLHGPWLPIYGAGVVLILLAVNKLRKKPLLEFIGAVVLCGLVEYFTSYFVEITHDGTQWWNYSGYFLNLNGRICAEGLLVFGMGGCAAVYFGAPLLDNLFKRINRKIAVPLCIVLLVVFGIDAVYSMQNPNTGKGITDYDTTAAYDTYDEQPSSLLTPVGELSLSYETDAQCA